MEYEGTPVGTLVTSGKVNAQSQFEYTQELALTSMRNTTITAKQTLCFTPDSPHLLEHASLEKFGPDSAPAYETVFVQRKGIRLSVPETEKPFKNLPHDYSLQQFFGLEKWLARSEVEAGDELSLVTIQLEQHDSIVDSWTIVESSASVVLIRSSRGIESEYDITRAFPQLKVSRHPSGLALRHVNNLPQSNTSSVALLSKQPSTVSVNESLPSPRALSVLELGVTFVQGEPGPWDQLLTPSGTLLIDYESAALPQAAPQWQQSDQKVRDSTREEIQRLADSIINASSTDNEILSEIVKFVHDHVRYSKSETPQSATTTLRRRSGDCSDIADLLSALATAAGLQARTVYGLAYDKASSSFGIHAWNQIRLNDGQLRIVDPTWNQLHADATHIEFPEAYAHEVLATLEHMEFSVIRYKHFESQI